MCCSSACQLTYRAEDDLDDVDDNSSDEEFHYPQSEAEETPTPLSRSSTSADYFSRPGQSRVPADLTPQLTQAPDFRVPTREAPQKVLTPRWTSPTPHQLHAQWERDETVSQCRDCQRRFNFLNRRVSSTFLFPLYPRFKFSFYIARKSTLAVDSNCIFVSHSTIALS